MRFLVSITVFLLASALVAPSMRLQSSSMLGQSESGRSSRPSNNGASEAPTGFILESNGFAEEFCANQRVGEFFELTENSCGRVLFQAAAEEFAGPETVADGLGPVFNAAGCGECHLTPILGGSSQVTEKRVGFFDRGQFTEPRGVSLIQDRALDPSIHELAPSNASVSTYEPASVCSATGLLKPSTTTSVGSVRESCRREVIIIDQFLSGVLSHYGSSA
jgi:hypothetical protein